MRAGDGKQGIKLQWPYGISGSSLLIESTHSMISDGLILNSNRPLLS